MTTPPQRHRIEQTRNRHSRATLQDDFIVIRLARGLSALEERRHIDTLLGRMARAKARHASRQIIDPFRPLLDGAETLELTSLVPHILKIRVHEGHRMSLKKMGDEWRVTRQKDTDTKMFHRLLWNVFSRHSVDYIDAYVRSINDTTLGATLADVTMKYMRSRWGSCSPHGVIALSTPLLCTSLSILRYVTIHELCHTRHADHSSRFWSAVEYYEPEYRQRVKELQMLRLPSC